MTAFPGIAGDERLAAPLSPRLGSREPDTKLVGGGRGVGGEGGERVADALVDTGATLLSLPTRVIRELGLQAVVTKRVTSSAGVGEATMYDTVRLTVLGRSCGMDVIEVPDTVPVLIGQIPLEHLDFTIDMRGRSLVGNPAHGGEHVYELY